MSTGTAQRPVIRAIVGSLLAGALALGVAHALLGRAFENLATDTDDRSGIVALNALTAVVQSPQSSDDTLRRTVQGWQTRTSGITASRIVRIAGAELLASTAAHDSVEAEAPRRLERDEKPLFDMAQRLRSAVNLNRDEGAPRKNEIEVESLPKGGRSFSGPFVEDGEISGLVQVQSIDTAVPRRPSWWITLGLILMVVGCAVVPAFVFRRRSRVATWGAVGAGAIGLIAALTLHGSFATKALMEAQAQGDAAIAARARSQADAVSAVIPGDVATEDSLAPGAWDTDVYRRSRGRLTADATILPAPPMPSVFGKSLFLLFAFALVLLATTVLGGFHALGRALRDNRVAYAYILPAIVGMALLVYFPFVYGVVLSFTDSTLYNANQGVAETWIGLRNYADIIFDFNVFSHGDNGWVVNYSNFYWTLFFTIVWTITNVTIGVTVGLALALVLNIKNLWFKPLYRVVLILPWAVPNYITALVWKGMFHRQFGVINQVLEIFGRQPISWFDNPLSSFATALATNGWLSFPFMMVVSMGALQSIPEELYEAAEVDGASWRQRFFAITLPALRPALVPAIILSVIWTFNMFNVIYLVTGGEPSGATEILVTQAYKFAFERYRYGYAAAYSTIIFMILLVYGIFQNRVSRATEA